MVEIDATLVCDHHTAGVYSRTTENRKIFTTSFDFTTWCDVRLLSRMSAKDLRNRNQWLPKCAWILCKRAGISSYDQHLNLLGPISAPCMWLSHRPRFVPKPIQSHKSQTIQSQWHKLIQRNHWEVGWKLAFKYRSKRLMTLLYDLSNLNLQVHWCKADCMPPYHLFCWSDINAHYVAFSFAIFAMPVAAYASSQCWPSNMRTSTLSSVPGLMQYTVTA